MKLRIVHFLQLLLVIIGAIMAVADKIQAISIIPDSWTPYWGLVVSTAIAIKPAILLIQDYLDDGEINNSIK